MLQAAVEYINTIKKKLNIQFPELRKIFYLKKLTIMTNIK
ncbi:unnamed protein product [Commensalibacter papalotli (ex Botero et al. 2024)]|uniref:Transposase n=1 Tax=Commensalibacter papalotli (ex Botero et al. 2024) TaxID=2972766 RepID=A0ABM9HNJ6_9PROT|nr:unnamed protein product [Commensalibacter papalotli (ex Botero et al. 2024)]